VILTHNVALLDRDFSNVHVRPDLPTFLQIIVDLVDFVANVNIISVKNTGCNFNYNKFPLVVDECALGTHRCDPIAQCTDTPEAYTCKCPDGFQDVSPDKQKNPGRQCEKGKVNFMVYNA